jgi:hypothetical protein
MNRKQCAGLILTTVVAGFLGGLGGSYMFFNEKAIAQDSAQPTKIVTAEEFRLVTKDGQPRATFLLWNGQLPALSMADEKCHNRVFLGVFNMAQPALILNDEECKQRASLDLQPEGLPALTLRDKTDVPRARIHLLQDGSPVLTLFDETGRELWSAPTSPSRN